MYVVMKWFVYLWPHRRVRESPNDTQVLLSPKSIVKVQCDKEYAPPDAKANGMAKRASKKFGAFLFLTLFDFY